MLFPIVIQVGNLLSHIIQSIGGSQDSSIRALGAVILIKRSSLGRLLEFICEALGSSVLVQLGLSLGQGFLDLVDVAAGGPNDHGDGANREDGQEHGLFLVG